MAVGTLNPVDQTPAAQWQGVPEFLALLAYGELAAYYRLAEDAALAPTLAGKAAIARMGAAQFQHFETLREALAARGDDVFQEMTSFQPVLDMFHARTTPSTWLEALVKFYVGEGLAADFYMEIADGLPPEAAVVVKEVLTDRAHAQFVVEPVRQSVLASPKERSRLALWARRLLGEAIAQAQTVLASREELADLLLRSSGNLNRIAQLFDEVTERHQERIRLLGLEG
jgi:1,2-phenylacetyl-CoA epoxidase catalytic subunit